MTRIHFYAGPEDNKALREKITSLGLRVYKRTCSASGMPVEQDADVYYGCISFLSPENLQTFEQYEQDGLIRISSTKNPLISWRPSYTVDHEGDRYILHGNLSWDFSDDTRSDDVEAGKRYFGQLSRWIRSNWPPVRKRGTCRGPQAQKMIQFESFIPRGLPPGLKVTYVQVPDRRRESSKAPPSTSTTSRPVAKDPAASKTPKSRRPSSLWRLVVLSVLIFVAAFLVLIWANSL